MHPNGHGRATLEQVIPSIGLALKPHLAKVSGSGKPLVGLELHPTMPERGTLDLLCNLSPLMGANNTRQGTAIVIDDVTERKTPGSAKPPV